jgi:ATP-binding cassette subfamily B (MDR/TAP) protein 1
LLSFFEEKLKKPESLIVRKSHIGGISIGFSQLVIFGIYGLIFYIGAILHRDNGLTIKKMLTAIFPVIFASTKAG